MRYSLLSLSALLFINLSLCTAPISRPHNTKTIASPKEYCIAWDIHGVLVQFNWQKALKQVNARSLASFIAKFTYNCVLKIVGKEHDNRYEHTVREILTLAKSEVSWQGFSETFKAHGFNDIAQSIKNIGLSYDVTPGIIQILDQLNAYGYRQYVASNIGSGFYHILREKQPDLFKHMEGGLTVAMSNIAEKINSNADVPRKPNPAFYALLREKNNIPDTVKIIFIDDKEHYIKGAQAAHGFIPIHFHSADTLKDILKKQLGISFTQ